MKKASRKPNDDLRPEYKRSDFGTLIRGKYAQWVIDATNVVVLDPQVAKAFPNDRAGNKAVTDASNRIVQKLWSYCNVLRDDGLSYQDYLEQLAFLLFLKMADERAALTGNAQSIPKGEIVHNARAYAALGVETLVISANTSDPSEARSAMEMLARAVLPAYDLPAPGGTS